jgi:phage terminase large subunit-like protein
VLRGESIELCISVPPRHGKTTLIVHWIVWLLIQKPDLQILYCSFGDRMAKKQTRAMRALARKVGLPLGELQMATEWTTAGGGRVRSCGITGAPTGDGFHVIVVDDPHRGRQSAESAAEKDTVVSAYLADIYTRQLPQGTSHIICATRWAVDDLTGVMTSPKGEDDDGPEPFALINLPAIDEDGRALAPDLWPVERLNRIRAKLGPYNWASLYQGRPVPKGGALFGAPTWADDPPTVAYYAGGVDLARTAKRKSDHQAGVMMARAPDGTITIVDCAHERALLTDRETDGVLEYGFVRPLHAMQSRWRGALFRMYVGGAETSLVDLLATHATHPVRIVAVKAIREKWDRAQAFAAAWNSGRVRVLRTCRHADALVTQLQRFTGAEGAPDDLVDACAAAFDEIDAGPVTASALHSGSALVAARPARRAARDRWT